MAAATPDPSVASTDREALLAALDADFRRPRLTAAYRVAILATAGILWLLPLIYVALIGLVGFGVWVHATESIVLFKSRGGPPFKLFLYVGPLVAGSLLLVFMLKPLFAKRRVRDDRVELDPRREPFVFEFVAAVCRAVGARPPRRILVHCDVNASAGFHQGGTGFASGGRELTIGLPLVLGLPLRNLTGVLAHEFGHFSQGTGMRLSMLVVRVQAWFSRVVFQRDSWDERIEEWSKSDFWMLAATGVLSRGLVWLTRRILLGLMWVAGAVSSYTSRQMEFDADRYQIALVGSPMVGQTLRELTVLGHADTFARRRLQRSWERGELVDDLPALTTWSRRSIPDEIVAKIERSIEDEEAQRFDSHPRTVDREAAAATAGDDGVFHDESPARVLFDDLAQACRDATIAHFKTALGRSLNKAKLVPVRDYVADSEDATASFSALRRYLQSTFHVMRAVDLPAAVPAAPDDPQGSVARLRELRAELRTERAELDRLVADLVESYGRLTTREHARDLVTANRTIRAADFGLSSDDPEAVADAIDDARRTIAAQSERVAARFAAVVDERLRLGLAMLGVPAVANRLDDAATLRAEATRLLATLRPFRRVVDDLVVVRHELGLLARLEEAVGIAMWSKSCSPVTAARLDRVRELCAGIRASLGELEHPFPTDDAVRTVVAWAMPEPSGDGRDAGGAREEMHVVREFAAVADDRLLDVYARLVGRLTSIGERVEDALGLEPLPVPVEEPAEPSAE